MVSRKPRCVWSLPPSGVELRAFHHVLSHNVAERRGFGRGIAQQSDQQAVPPRQQQRVQLADREIVAVVTCRAARRFQSVRVTSRRRHQSAVLKTVFVFHFNILSFNLLAEQLLSNEVTYVACVPLLHFCCHHLISYFSSSFAFLSFQAHKPLFILESKERHTILITHNHRMIGFKNKSCSLRLQKINSTSTEIRN